MLAVSPGNFEQRTELEVLMVVLKLAVATVDGSKDGRVK